MKTAWMRCGIVENHLTIFKERHHLNEDCVDVLWHCREPLDDFQGTSFK